MSIIVWIIQILHALIVIGIVFSVFINNCLIKQLVLTLLILLLIQYLFGFKKCGLTQLEYWFLGEKNYNKGFIYRLVNPIINTPEKYFYYGLFLFHIIWIVILFYQTKYCRK